MLAGWLISRSKNSGNRGGERFSPVVQQVWWLVLFVQWWRSENRSMLTGCNLSLEWPCTYFCFLDRKRFISNHGPQPATPKRMWRIQLPFLLFLIVKMKENVSISVQQVRRTNLVSKSLNSVLWVSWVRKKKSFSGCDWNRSRWRRNITTKKGCLDHC